MDFYGFLISSEHYVLTQSIILYILCSCSKVQLAHQKMLHVTFQLWIGSLLLHTIGILILGCGWLKFAQDGIKREELQSAGIYMQIVSM